MPFPCDQLEGVLALRAMGINTIPLNYPDNGHSHDEQWGKSPAIDAWKDFQSRMATTDEIRYWFLNGRCNVGAICGTVSNSLFVVDVDDPTLLKVFFEEDVYEIASKTFTVKTAKGYHLYFRDRERRRLQTSRIEFDASSKKRVDIQCDGTYVVGPPSLHASGNVYTVISPDGVGVREVDAEGLIQQMISVGIQHGATVSRKYRDAERAEKHEPVVNVPEGTIRQLLEETVGKDKMRLYKQTGTDTLQGSHPIHGSTTGSNFTVNLKTGEWYCFRHNVGGGVLRLVGILAGALQCDPAVIDRPLDENMREKLFLFAKGKNMVRRGEGKPAKKGRKKEDEEGVADIARDIMAKWHFATDKHNMGTFLVYREGVYVQEADEVVQDYVSLAMDNDFSRSKMLDIREYIRGRSMIEMAEPALELTCLKNGILNITTGIIQPHTPSLYFRSKLPINFIPEADCPNFKKFLSDILDEQDILTIQEMFGYCLYRDYSVASIFMMIGSGGNGKSTLLSVLKQFLGEGNTTHYMIHDFIDDKFAKANLRGKLANIFADITDQHIFKTAVIKTLTGNDDLNARQMFKQKVEGFTNYAKLIFSTNKPPIFEDASPALWRRIIEIDFTRRFEENPAWQNTLIESMTTDGELSGILNWALIGLQRLLDKRQFSNAQELEARRKSYMKKAKSSFAFVEDMIEPGEVDDFIRRDEIPTYYSAYCKQYNYFLQKKEDIYKEIRNEYGMQIREEQKRIDGKMTRIIVGIRWNDAQVKQLQHLKHPLYSAHTRDVHNSTMDSTYIWDEKGASAASGGTTENQEELRISYEAAQNMPPAESQKSADDMIIDILKNARGENIEQAPQHLTSVLKEYGMGISVEGVRKICERLTSEGKLRSRNEKYSSV